MSLDIYFQDKDGNLIDNCYYLNITHNLNGVVSELGLLVGLPYYEVIWRPDELFNLRNGKVPVKLIINRLPMLINDLIENEAELTPHLPSNGWGTFEGLIEFLCDYLKECYKHKEDYVYCCR